MWNMPLVSTHGINFYPLNSGRFLYKNLDQGWLEFYGAQKIYYFLVNDSKFMQFFFSNNIKVFIMLMCIWLIFIFLIYLSSLN
jgi:NADH-ubiquinone oxidoreductase chain 5